jgi:hypothetical protein
VLHLPVGSLPPRDLMRHWCRHGGDIDRRTKGHFDLKLQWLSSFTSHVTCLGGECSLELKQHYYYYYYTLFQPERARCVAATSQQYYYKGTLPTILPVVPFHPYLSAHFLHQWHANPIEPRSSRTQSFQDFTGLPLLPVPVMVPNRSWFGNLSFELNSIETYWC